MKRSVAERWVTVSAPGGLHARLAGRMVRAARGVAARVTVAHGGRVGDATSLTSLLALGADVGSRVRVTAQGDDAETALNLVAALLSGEDAGGTHMGRGVSPGVGVGWAVLTVEASELAPDDAPVERDAELRMLHLALDEARAQLAALEVWAEREIGGASQVLRAERELLDDAMWLGLIEERIRDGGASARAAVHSVTHSPGLAPREGEGGPPDGLREVLRDVGARLERILTHRAAETPDIRDDALILVARQISPSELLEWPRERLAGVAAVRGSAQSHAALVARALRVPMVVGVGEGLLATLSKAAAKGGAMPLLRVDGDGGLVVIGLQGAEAVLGVQARRAITGPRSPRVARGQPRVLANADTVDEVRQALDAGAEGIGLVRTERLFLGRDVPPDEEEQYRALGAMAAACGGRPVTFRLADLGGDKIPPYLVPLLGRDGVAWRGAALLARYPALARPHLRAMARVVREYGARFGMANEGESIVTVMVPMVATTTEWAATLALWREAADAVGAAARLSLLVETPAAALDVARFLPEADEVAIGTNDLTALLFGADRERGPSVRVPPLQPVTLRLLAQVVRDAHHAGKPVTVCGEAAGHVPDALVLWGLGVDALSVAPERVTTLAQAMGAIGIDEVQRLSDALVGLREVTGVLALLERWRRDLASRGITIPGWHERWEDDGVAYNGDDQGSRHGATKRDDLGGGLA